MVAKEKYKIKLLDLLSNPENDFPTRIECAKMIGIGKCRLYQLFTPAELQDIENDAYEIRKKNSTRQRATLLKALYEEGKNGNVSAVKEFFDRTEGKVVEKHDLRVSSLEDLVTGFGENGN